MSAGEDSSEAGVRVRRFHDLRHSFGSLAIQQFDLVAVKNMMGHSKLTTTERYLHSKPRPDGVAKLTNIFSKGMMLETHWPRPLKPTECGRANGSKTSNTWSPRVERGRRFSRPLGRASSSWSPRSSFRPGVGGYGGPSSFGASRN
jgi:hypothetical protein